MGIYHRVIDGLAKTRVGGWMIVHLFTLVDRRLMRWTNEALNTVVALIFMLSEPNGAPNPGYDSYNFKVTIQERRHV
jgi:hypothetical protein